MPHDARVSLDKQYKTYQDLSIFIIFKQYKTYQDLSIFIIYQILFRESGVTRSNNTRHTKLYKRSKL